MNRRAFLVSSFMFGLLLATGIRPKHAPDLPKWNGGPVWVRVSTDDKRNAYSLDGKTWTPGLPPNGTPACAGDNPPIWQDGKILIPA